MSASRTATRSFLNLAIWAVLTLPVLAGLCAGLHLQPATAQEPEALPPPLQAPVPPPELRAPTPVTPGELQPPPPLAPSELQPPPSVLQERYRPQIDPESAYGNWPMPQSSYMAPPMFAGKATCCPPAAISIKYRNHPLCRKRCCKGHPAVPTVLMVNDPCTPCACPIEVPVCIPCCATGLPRITPHRGLLGRQCVTYTWCNGFTIKLIFRCRGDLLVHYYGL
jgi:hypothetical protein